MHQIAPFKKLSGKHAPKPPRKPCAACGFATCKFPNLKKIIIASPPPPPNPGYALVNCDIFIIYVYYRYVCMFDCVFIFYMDNV